MFAVQKFQKAIYLTNSPSIQGQQKCYFDLSLSGFWYQLGYLWLEFYGREASYYSKFYAFGVTLNFG